MIQIKYGNEYHDITVFHTMLVCGIIKYGGFNPDKDGPLITVYNLMLAGF